MQLIRVTQLEQFRKYLTFSSYVTEQDVIATLSGEFKGNNKTRIGTAGHRIIESGTEALVADIRKDSFIIPVDDQYYSRFSPQQTDMLMQHRESLHGAFHELKHGKTYHTRHYPVHIGGTQDLIHGITIRDTKFAFRRPDAYNYWNSCQWKFYLEFLGLDVFYFDLFEFKGYKDEMLLNVSGLELIQHEPLECIRYRAMEQDNQRLVETFVDWIEAKGLTHLLMKKEKYYE